MTTKWELLDDVLDAASELAISSGLDGITMPLIAERSGATLDEIATLFDSADDIVVSMLNREFRVSYARAIIAIEADPRGGCLSRLWYHTLTTQHESPVARLLHTTDRAVLASLMNHSHGFRYAPTPEARQRLIETMQDAGLIRRDIDAAGLAWTLTAFSAGLAFAAPHDEVEAAVRGLCDLLHSAVDTDAVDVSAGRRAYYAFVTHLAV